MTASRKDHQPPVNIPVYGLQLHDPEPRFTECACPRCRGTNLTLIEVWETAICWKVTGGWLDRANGHLEDGAPIGRMRANCGGCGHEWTLKKASSICDVLTDESLQSQ